MPLFTRMYVHVSRLSLTCLAGLLFASLYQHGYGSDILAVSETQIRGGLPNVRASIDAGKDVRVAFLGGSITAAAGWRVFTLERLRAQYRNTTFTEINAAVSGTGSDFGATRLQRDVLRHHPDLLFVEFSVNDVNGSPEVEAQTEGIVRQSWLANPATDVCFVYTVSVSTLGPLLQGHYQSAAAAMELVATHYAIPSFNFGVEIARRLKAGTLVMSAPAADKADSNGSDARGRLIFTRDGTHPGDAGHRVYTDRLMAAFPQLLAAGQPGVHRLREPRRADNWQSAGMVLIGDLRPGNRWHQLGPDAPQVNVQKGPGLVPPTWFADEPGATLDFQFRGTVLGLVGLKGPDNGEFEVAVDNEPARRATLFDAYSTPGRYYLKPWFYSKHLPDGPHYVRLTVLPSKLDKMRIMAEAGVQIADPAPYAGHGLYLSGVLLSGELLGP